MTSSDARLLWYEALSASRGLLLRSSNPALARQRLYAERAKLGDPQLAGLEIRLIELSEGNMMILKRPSLEELGLASGASGEESKR